MCELDLKHGLDLTKKGRHVARHGFSGGLVSRQLTNSCAVSCLLYGAFTVVITNAGFIAVTPSRTSITIGLVNILSMACKNHAFRGREKLRETGRRVVEFVTVAGFTASAPLRGGRRPVEKRATRRRACHRAPSDAHVNLTRRA